jgi:hypothetical protein
LVLETALQETLQETPAFAAIFAHFPLLDPARTRSVAIPALLGPH